MGDSYVSTIPFPDARDDRLATTGHKGLMSKAAFAKLAGMEVPLVRLAYAANTDLANATSMGTAGTVNTLVAAQNFTVSSAASLLDVFVNCGVRVQAPAALTQCVMRALVDGTTLYRLNSEIALASGWMSFDGGAVPVGGLAAGTHTIAITMVASQNTALLSCLASTSPTYEFFTITIVERNP